MTIANLLDDNVKIIAVVCNQWGDTGKGKFSDYFSEWADVIARGTGGNNAGHTVVINGKERIFHLIPAGISFDKQGKINILGNGLVLDLKVVCGELDELYAEGLSYNNLMISKDAHVIMPYHVDIDKAKNQSQSKGGIGSTGRGIGPCYTDKIARTGITLGDLLKNKEHIVKKIKKAQPQLSDSDIENILNELKPYVDRLKPFVKNTVAEMHKFAREGKKILLEGAQGLLLSIEHGTYPYVTSSDCSVNGTASGVGISAGSIDLVFGIVKFPFMTRVGGGPFPTELGGKKSEEYCGDDNHRKEFELKTYGIPYEIINGKIKYNIHHAKILEMINSVDEFIQGVGIRLAAGEYGATTGRARRTGWTDAVAGKYAVGINAPLKLILTKVDSLSNSKEFKICYCYEHNGKVVGELDKDPDFLNNVQSIYKTYEGYGDIAHIDEFDKLPESLLKAIKDFEEFTGAEVVVVSVGADRNQTIVR